MSRGLAFCWIAGLLVAASLPCACAESTGHEFFLNLFPLGDDPFERLSSLEARLDPEGDFVLEDFGSSGRFGPIPGDSPCRIELRGLEDSGNQLSWGFSGPLQLGEGDLKTTVFFSSLAAAVAHAGPGLVDPAEGLEPAGIPLSLKMDTARSSVAFNGQRLLLDLQVDDESVVDNQDAWDSGDLVMVYLDGRGDSIEDSLGLDDVVLAFGQSQFVEIWNPVSVPIIRDFSVRPEGYAVFAGIPFDTLTDALGPGPNIRMRLGVEIHDRDSPGASPQVSLWPSGWKQESQELEHDLSNLGDLFLKSRVLDARETERNAVGFDPGIDDFLGSGAVRLSRATAPGEDRVRVYALWDSTALMLAVDSNDGIYCTQDRAEGDRAGILRDDAVEISLVKPDGGSYRALFSLQGSTAYDRLDGSGWQPAEIYFRFDLDGPLPDNDCQTGEGFTFKARIPWLDLGYSDQPPGQGTVFAFDLVVYDNDRGARSVGAFSPLGPSEVAQHLAELRLFSY